MTDLLVGLGTLAFIIGAGVALSLIIDWWVDR